MQFTKFSRYKRKARYGNLWITVFERDNYKCTFCGSKEDLTIDHITPMSAGGKTLLDNLRVLCRSHNTITGRSYCGTKSSERRREQQKFWRIAHPGYQKTKLIEFRKRNPDYFKIKNRERYILIKQAKA